MKFKDIKLPANKNFGLFFGFVFFLVFLYFYNGKIEIIDIFNLLLSLMFVIISLTKAEILLPLNKSWMFLGFLLSKIVSPIVLGLLFFGFITPLALFLKLIGRDELKLKHKNTKTFWKLKDEIKDYKTFFNNQF